jgi:molecular chaperone GrpE
MADDSFETPDNTAAAAQAERPDASADADAVRKERDEYYDRLLRKTAEFDNYRRRTDRERQQLADAAAADLLKDLLPLVDDLERAIKADAGGEASAPIRRGVEMIHQQLLETLRKRGVTPIDALGADFDPHFHMAVAHDPAEGRRDGEVIEEFTRGYMLGDRLLRPAMVKVAKW